MIAHKKTEQSFDIVRSKRNSQSSLNTIGTNIQQNSVSTIDSPLKPIKEKDANSFKRKRDMTNSEERNVNKEISKFMKEKLSFEQLSRDEIRKIKETSKQNEQNRKLVLELQFKEKKATLICENRLLVESLLTEKNSLTNKFEKVFNSI